MTNKVLIIYTIVLVLLLVTLLYVSNNYDKLNLEYNNISISYNNVKDKLDIQNTAIKNLEVTNINDSAKNYNNKLTINRDNKIKCTDSTKNNVLTLIDNELKQFSTE